MQDRTIKYKKRMKVLLPVDTDEKVTEGISVCVDSFDIDSECCAYFQASAYQDIFNKKKQDVSQSEQRLSVVKICRGKRKIYRKYVAKSPKGLTKDYIVLSLNACQQLGIKRYDIDKEVRVTKSWWFPFYWYHSNSATRVSFRVGLISLFIGLLGIGLGVLSIIL